MPSVRRSTPNHISVAMLVVWYESLLNRYNTIKESTNAIDNKTSIILAASVAVLIFGVSNNGFSTMLLGVVGIVGVGASIILCLVNINLKQTPAEVNSSDDHPDYYFKKDEAFIWQLIADLEQAIDILTIANRRKAVLYRWVAGLFVVSTVVLLSANYLQIVVVIK